MTNPKQSSKGLLIGISIIVLAGLGGSAFYLKKLQSQQQATAESPATETPAPTAAPESSTATTTESTAAANGKVDLATDESGLSKAIVSIKTDKGVIKFKFYSKDAPNTTNRIVELIQKKFYDGLTFHRVVPGFVIQGGDPNGNGTGGSGQTQKAEFNSRKHVEGTVAMARASDPDSADSQFYIALGTIPHLDEKYTVFGQVIEGMEVVKKIAIGDKMTSVSVQ